MRAGSSVALGAELVDEGDCAVMLTKPDPDGAGPVLPGTGA